MTKKTGDIQNTGDMTQLFQIGIVSPVFVPGFQLYQAVYIAG